jgi:hypothetical protein
MGEDDLEMSSECVMGVQVCVWGHVHSPNSVICFFQIGTSLKVPNCKQPHAASNILILQIGTHHIKIPNWNNTKIQYSQFYTDLVLV